MTRENKQELWHTLRGPVVSALVTLALAGFWWALNYKANKQELYDKVNDHEKRLTSVEQAFKDYLKVKQECDVKLEGRLASIETEIKNLNRRRGQ